MVPIVVIAYNRPHSLKRLLHSIGQARYSSEDITLIISIDYGKSNKDVVEVANSFDWSYGSKKVIYQKKNLGLRQHVLKCGDYCLEYGSVILLEDDLFVSKDFYNYSIQALSFSEGKEYIGGISLYNHQLNVHNYLYFSPVEDGFDNWYFQLAASWGQAWTRSQWSSFKDWYTAKDKLEKSDQIPAYVLSWSDKSWLKYYIVFLIENQKYFLYPKISLSTNFHDAGTHVGSDSTQYQVPLYEGEQKIYRFSTLDASRSTYDAFFENTKLYEVLGVPKEILSVNLYGAKPSRTHALELSQEIKNRVIIRSFARALKPLDMNVLMNISGDEIYLYDMTKKYRNRRKKDQVKELRYFYKGLNLGLWKKLLGFLKIEFIQALKSKI